MWSLSHEMKAKSFVKSVAADLAQSSGSSHMDPQMHRAYASALKDAVCGALSDLAAVVNDAAPINKLPPELLSEVARYLPLTTIMRVLCICRRWRAILERDTRLWTSVEVHFVINPTRWAGMLDVLLARSRKFPLRLTLLFHCSTHALQLAECVQLALTHLEHIVELCVGLPTASLPLLLTLLPKSPAPILETLRILSADPAQSALVGYVILPEDCFAKHAPRLRTLYLRGALIPASGSPALTQVRTVAYDHYPGTTYTSLIIASLQHCPALDTVLLLTGGMLDPVPPAAPPPPAMSVTTVLLSDVHAAGTDAFLDHFPSASTTVMSFGTMNPDLTSAPPRLASFFSSAAPLTAVDIRLRPFGLLLRPPRPAPYISLSVNGALVAVDVGPQLVRDLFSNGLSTVDLDTLTRLGVPLAFGDFLAMIWPRLTALRNLTLYCDFHWALAWPADIPRTAVELECLRIEFTPSRAAPISPTWKPAVCAALRTICKACSVVTRLTFAGMPYLSEGDVPPEVSEMTTDPDASAPRGRAYEPWFWDFDEDAALHV